MAADLGVRIEPDAADAVCDLLNGELTAIRTEIDKLSAYVGERRMITRADVDLLVISSRKYEVWDLTDVLAARQQARALEFLYRLLREGEQPVALLGALAWMYRKLLEAQELPVGVAGWQAASRLKMRPEKAELAVRQSRKFPKAQLAAGLAALYEADNRLKFGGTNQRAVMEFLVAQLASPSAAA
jgi:DNA polymerase III subunit delta